MDWFDDHFLSHPLLPPAVDVSESWNTTKQESKETEQEQRAWPARKYNSILGLIKGWWLDNQVLPGVVIKISSESKNLETKVHACFRRNRTTQWKQWMLMEEACRLTMLSTSCAATMRIQGFKPTFNPRKVQAWRKEVTEMPMVMTERSRWEH